MIARHFIPTQRGRKPLTALAAGALLGSLVLAAGNALATPSNFLELDGNVTHDAATTPPYDWANGGMLTSPASVGGVWTRAGTGGIFDGGIFRGNTTPPTSPGLTSSAAADATIAAASFKVDPLSVDNTACGTGDPTAYTGAGSEKNGDVLSTDTFGTASIPNKDDLSNVYAVAHQTSGGVNEVFFGAERVVNNGDSHIDFEFLQNAVTIPNACSGSFSGDRAQGDFLMSVDFTTGGTLGGTTIYQWHCLAETQAQPATGTVCNPVPKTTYAKAHYQQVGSDATTIKVNGGSGVGCGGWVCRNADGTPTNTIATNELMEGGIDLAQLGFQGCISTFLPHTRSAQQFSATLKDFEIIPFNTCAHPTIATQVKKTSDDSAVSGVVPVGTSVYDTATLSGATSNAGGTVTYRVYTDNTCSTLLGGTAGNAFNTAAAVTVTNGSVPNSANLVLGSPGYYYFQATYSGDLHNIVPTGGAKSPCTSELVTASSPAITTQVKKASDDSNVTGVVPVGTIVYDTASLTGVTPDAGGSVTYRLYSDSACTTLWSGASTFNAAAAVTVTNGVAPKSSNVTLSSPGYFYFQANYSGDTNNPVPTGGLKSDCTSELVTVSSPAITTQVKDAGNHNVTAPVAVGSTLHDTASLTGVTPDAGGTVTYRIYTDNTCSTLLADAAGTVFNAAAGKTVTNGSALDSDGIQLNTAGYYWFQATYSGDSNNPVPTGGLKSTCTSEAVTVSSPAVSTTIKGTDGNAISGSQPIGTVLHDSATISNVTPDAGGTISYALYANDDCTGLIQDLTPTNHTVVAGAAPDSSTYTFNGAGTFYFYAVYSGDTNNPGPVNSGCASEPVTISPNTPAAHSTPVVQIKDTFSVSGFAAPAAGAPQVFVKLYDNNTCGGTALQSAGFDVPAAGGTLTNSTTFIAELTGTYYYQISYAGDTNNNGFTTTCTAESVGINITSLP